jgi:hypothetical protein
MLAGVGVPLRDVQVHDLRIVGQEGRIDHRVEDRFREIVDIARARRRPHRGALSERTGSQDVRGGPLDDHRQRHGRRCRRQRTAP